MSSHMKHIKKSNSYKIIILVTQIEIKAKNKN